MFYLDFYIYSLTLSHWFSFSMYFYNVYFLLSIRNISIFSSLLRLLNTPKLEQNRLLFYLFSIYCLFSCSFSLYLSLSFKLSPSVKLQESILYFFTNRLYILGMLLQFRACPCVLTKLGWYFIKSMRNNLIFSKTKLLL